MASPCSGQHRAQPCILHCKAGPATPYAHSVVGSPTHTTPRARGEPGGAEEEEKAGLARTGCW